MGEESTLPMSLTQREVVDFDPLADWVDEDEPESPPAPAVPEPEPEPVEHILKKGIKVDVTPDVTPDLRDPTLDPHHPHWVGRAKFTKEPEPAAPEAPPARVLPEFHGFGPTEEEDSRFGVDASASMLDWDQQPKKPVKKKEANFGSMAEDDYGTSLFGTADAADQEEVDDLFEGEQHQTLLTSVETAGKKKKKKVKAVLAAATNESADLAADLASLQTESADDAFLDSLSKPVQPEPLFPEKGVVVAEAGGPASTAGAAALDDDLFSMGGATTAGGNAAAGAAGGFDFDSYIAQNKDASAGGLFD